MAKSIVEDLLQIGKATAYDTGKQLAQSGAQVVEGINRTANTIAGRPLVSEDAALLRGLATDMAQRADAARAGINADDRQAMADSQITGNLFKGEIGIGPKWSGRGLALNLLDGLASSVPSALAAVATKGRSLRTQAAVGAAVGAAQGAGEASFDEGQRVRQMDAAQVAALPAYQQALAAGASPQQAQERVARAAERTAFATTAPVSALGGAATSALIGKPVQGALERVVGGSRVGRAALSATAGGLEEGAQEVGEGVAQALGGQLATGEQRDLGEGSAANLVLGAAAGGTLGATGGAMEADPAAPQHQQPAAPVVVNPARGPLSRALAAGAAAGDVPGIHVEQPAALGAPGDFGDLTQAPAVPAAATPVPTQSAPAAGLQLNAQTLSTPFAPLGRGYAADAGPRMQDETAKSYAKRVIDRLPAPTAEQLPAEPARYFNLDKADVVVPLAQLLASKGAQPEASANALKRMAAAAEGVLERRDPIDVRANEDGTYTVLDGNGTLGAALQAGLSQLPVRIKEAPSGREGWRYDRGYHPPQVAEALTRTYETAAREKPLFDQTNQTIAKELGLDAPAVVDLKGRTRAEQKLVGYRGDVRKLSDLVRTTFEVDTLDQVAPLLQRLQQAYPAAPENWKLKHFLDVAAETPYAGGYRDSKMVATLPDGTRAEVQINLKPMLEAKKRAHDFYEDFRKLDEAITNEGRQPTPEELARLDALDQQMRAIYAPAWDAVLNASKAAASIGTPSSATATRENTRPAGTSNAITNSVPSARQMATGTPLTSKNLASAAGVYTGEAPVSKGSVNTTDTTTSAPAALGREDVAPGWNRRRSTTYGLVVAPKPGTKVQRGEAIAVYDRAIDGANQPPLAAPVQRAPDLDGLTEAAAQVIRRPAAQAALRRAFGVKGLKMTTLRGSYEGVPETSWHIEAKDLTEQQARDVALFLGMAFSQDAVIVTKPDPVGADEESIPTLELSSTDGAKLSASAFEQVAAALQAQGIDYSEAREGRGIRVLHFGDEAGYRRLVGALQQIAADTGLELDMFHTRSDLYEAQDYRRHLQGAGAEGRQGLGPEVFRALVDHFLVPHTRAAAGAGYRFDADRYAARFGLDDAEAAYLKSRLAQYAPRSSVPVLTGEEAIEPLAKGEKRSNVDAAWILQNRSAQFGQIDPSDRSPAAKETIAETLAQEIVHQINKPDGKQAVGWYDRQLTGALDEVSKLHPEIATDANAQFVFKALLATTSQNLTVEKNFEVANAIYERYKETGRFDLSGLTLPGKAAPIAKENVGKLQAMIDARGLEATAAFMREKHTVRELKQLGFKNVSGRLDEKVRGWLVFGPKIGSFGNNLDGDFETLTADLWFSRTWNRVLGTMFRYSPQAEAKQIEAFRAALGEALAKPGSNAIVDGLSEAQRAQLGSLDADFALASALHREFSKGFKDRSALNRAAKGWVENVTHLQDAPRGDPERRWQNEVMREVQAKVAQRTGEQVSIADLQALLWYQEKELFRLLGAANKSSAPLDYLDAARKLVASRLPAALGNAATQNATMVQAKYPLGAEHFLSAVRRAVPGVRVVVAAGTDKAALRIAIEGEVTDTQRQALQAIAGVREVYPGGFPDGVDLEPQESVAPRYQVPPQVARAKGYGALDADGRAQVDAALGTLRAQGYPRAWLDRAKFFAMHDNGQQFAALFHLEGDMRGGVTVRVDRLGSGKGLVADLSHELAHAADFDAATGTFASLASPRFALTEHADGSIEYTGDVIAELFRASQDSPLDEYLKYPFAREDFHGDIVRVEAFARAVELYMTRRALLKRHAPTTYAMVEEMFRDAENGPAQERDGAVSRALRTTDRRAIAARAFNVRAPEGDRAVARVGNDGPAADGRGPRSGERRDAEGLTDPEVIAELLQDHGEQPASSLDAERRWSNGEAFFAAHELDEDPVEVTSYDMLRNYAPDQLMAVPRSAYEAALEQAGALGNDSGLQTDSPAFRRWFGDSKVVDAEDKPLVVYHGTNADFDAFDPAKVGSAYGTDEQGFFFTSSEDEAQKWADRAPGATSPKVLPVYLSIENAWVIDAPEGMGPVEYFESGKGPFNRGHAAAVQYGVDSGYDGMIVRGNGETMFVAFRPEQIKSATGNNGAFDPANPSILGSPGAPASTFDGWTMPSWQLSQHLSQQAGTRLSKYQAAARAGGDKLRTLLQDYFLPVRRVQEAITAKGGTVDEASDVYGAEELYYGRTGEQLRRIEDQHVKPLVQAMVKAGVDPADLELYLYAKFAPSRNARIAKINPKMPDGGSGMTNADAAQVLADFDAAGRTAALEALARRVRDLNALRIDTLERGGLLTAQEAADWRAEPDYVPLKGIAEGLEDDGATRLPTGGGFSIGGREAHRALGRQSRASNLLANTIAQVEQAVIRAEKNRVAQSLLRLAEANPNAALWTVDKAPKKKQLSPSGEVVERTDNLHKLADNVVLAKVDGVEHFVTIKDRRLAEAVKNMGAARVGAVLRTFSSVNRFLSLTRTMLAPEFVLANFARDLQTASINLTSEQSSKMAARVLKDVPVSIRAMWAQLRGSSMGGEWGRWAQEFADAGGMTSFVAQRTVEEQQAAIDALVADARGGKVAATKRLAREALGFVEDLNGSVENATRLAAYANARRQGMSAAQAARLAKNLTVNFNRKGQVGPVINSLYLFYNASLQGTARFLRASRQPKMQAFLAASAAAGFALAMMNRAAMGADDDGEDKWDKIPDWEKARNLIIAVPGSAEGYVKVPVPYTYNLPFLIGNEVEGMLHSKRPASSGAANVANAMIGAFNPVGEFDLKGDASVAAAKLLSPSAVDPLVDIATNTNYFGAPINPVKSPFDKTPDPDSETAFPSTNPFARALAETLNTATGGSKVKSGLIDVSPGSMVYLFDFLTGGTGSFVERATTAATLAAQGKPVPARTIPFYRTFAGELSDRRVTDTFYTVRDDVRQRAEDADLALKTGGFDSPQARQEGLRMRALGKRLDHVERQLSAVRRLRKKAQAAGNDEAVERFQQRERALQLNFNRAYFKALDAGSED